MRKISKDMIIADLVTIDPNIVVILMRAGMHCIGCPHLHRERPWKRQRWFMDWM